MPSAAAVPELLAPAGTREALEAGIKAGADIEDFVHGDMCIAHSGQRFHSGISAGQSASRVKCLKPCRRRCDLVNLRTERAGKHAGPRGRPRQGDAP